MFDASKVDVAGREICIFIFFFLNSSYLIDKSTILKNDKTFFNIFI